MQSENLKRRDFHKLTMAALGGLLAGGCAGSGGDSPEDAKADAGDQNGQAAAAPQLNVDPAMLVAEPHVCRGLNTCETKGMGGKNACAGQSACASVAAHACNGMNACKGQGGCGGYPGQNTCETKGHCAVPLGDETWKIARKQFEHLMGEMKKPVGAAPAKT
jgi:hypothetical protein